MMEEYRSSGGDMENVSAFMDFINAFGRDGATPFLGLNRWRSSDKPVMEDFNADNEKIDDAVRRLWERKAEIMTEDVTLYVSKAGSDLSGNGTQNAPFFTIQKALDYARVYLTGRYYIWILVGNGVYREDLDTNLGGLIVIQSQSKNAGDVVIEGKVTARHCRVFYLNLLTINRIDSGTDATVYSMNSCLRVYDCVINCNGANGIHVDGGSADLQRTVINQAQWAIAGGEPR